MAKKTNTAARKRSVKKKDEPVVRNTAVGEDGIDIVVPMVFPNGLTWLRNYREACRKHGRDVRIDERFRSWGLERYFFRGIAKNLPFVRKIHLILSDENQIPFWLNTDKVHIVLHKDIMPADILPTFNSSTIEMWLHNIEGLSETFIYCNDDMIATAPTTAEDFFVGDKPVTRCSEKHKPIAGSFLKMVRHGLEMIAKDHGLTFPDDVLLRDGHSYAPMLLSVIMDVVDKHGDAMRESCTAFRQEKNFNQYIYTYEMWFRGLCTGEIHKHRYFSLSSPYDDMARMLLDGTAGVACFNDGDIGDWNEMKNVLFRTLQQILGDKCEYEV